MQPFCHNQQCRFHRNNSEERVLKYLVLTKPKVYLTEGPSSISDIEEAEVYNHPFSIRGTRVFFCDFCSKAIEQGNFCYMQE